MLLSIARLIGHKPSRVILGVFALAVSIYFGPLCFAMLADPRDHFWFVLGLGSTTGLFGWWARVLLSPAMIGRHPVLRIAVLAALTAGTAAAVYAFFYGSAQDIAWRLFTACMVFAGVLMFLGTLAGPNKSFKPTPLRGSA